MPRDFKPSLTCYCGSAVPLEKKIDHTGERMYTWEGRCVKCPEYWSVNLINSTKEIFG